MYVGYRLLNKNVIVMKMLVKYIIYLVFSIDQQSMYQMKAYTLSFHVVFKYLN